MPELSTENAAIWRSADYNMEPVLYVHRPAVVLDALVNMPGGAISYPMQSVFYDGVIAGSYTNCLPGMLICFGSVQGADDLGRTRVIDISSSLISIPRASKGRHDGEVDLVDNCYIRIYDLDTPRQKNPFITDTGEMFKDTKEAYTDQGLKPRPTANCGPYAMDLVAASDNMLDIPFDGSLSEAYNGASITEYLWDFGDGTPSSATTATVSSVKFPVGARYIKLRVKDSNNNYHTARALVVAVPRDYAGLSGLILNAELQSGNKRMAEHSLQVRIDEPLDSTTFPDGTCFMLMWREWYDNVEHSLAGPTGRERVRFVGWHFTDTAKIAAVPRGGLKSVTYTALDLAGWMQRQAGFPQRLDRESAPTNWAQRAGANIDEWLDYMIRNHHTAKEIADVYSSGIGSTFPFVGLDSSGSKIWGQLDNRCEAVAYKLTCDFWGRIKARRDALLWNLGERTSVNMITLTEADIAEDGISYTHERYPKNHWANETAVLTSTSDASSVTKVGGVYAIAPGLAPNEGGDSYDKGEQLAVNQQMLKDRAGHRLARANATEAFLRVRLLHPGFIGLDPAFCEFVRLTLSYDYAAQRGLTFTNERFFLQGVEWEYHKKERRVVQVLILERETFGDAATGITPKESPEITPYDNPYNVLPLDNLVNEIPSSLGRGVGRIAIPSTDGYFYRTLSASQDFETPSSAGGPLWTRVSMGVSGTPVAAVADPYCPKYLNGTGTVDVFVVTTSGIYKVVDVFGTPVATLQKTFRTAGITRRSLQASFDGNPNLLVTSAYTDGVYATWTTDGSTWATEELKGGSSPISGDIAYPAASVSSKVDGLVYLSAYVNSTTADGYKSTDHGDTATALGTPDIDPGVRLAGDIHEAFASGEIYHGADVENLTWEHTFDFIIENDAWSAENGTWGNYIAGVGWSWVDVFPGGNSFRLVYIRRGLTLNILSVTVRYQMVYAGAGSQNQIQNSNNPLDSWTGATGTFEHTWNAPGGTPVTIVNLQALLVANDHAGVGALSGSALITSITITGPGTNPFTGLSTTPKLVKVVGSTKTDVSPLANFRPLRGRQVDTDATNAQYVVACVENHDATQSGVYVSQNAAGAWTALVAATSASKRPLHVAISSDGHQVIYALGSGGYVGCCTDLATMDDRSGNIPVDFPSAGEFLNIFGG